MKQQIIGKQSIVFEKAPFIVEGASIVGKKEGDGPLGSYFDVVEEDAYFGGKDWEEAESRLQNRTVRRLLYKTGKEPEDIRYIFSGDLLGQLIGTTFGLMDLNIPLFGLYGACSTMGEAMILGAMTMAAGYAGHVVSMASSHFAGVEKNFRYPLAYGNQRPFSATWTVTGCGAVLLGPSGGKAKIEGVTPGCIVDYGCKDTMNMGAAMSPACANTLVAHLEDFERVPEYYDKIITGDLGSVGQRILFELMEKKGYDISKVHMDCGMEIFDSKLQDTHAGGSGCGCSASVFCGYVLNKLRTGEWKRILFVPTGAMLSDVTFREGKSIPGIAHAISIEGVV